MEKSAFDDLMERYLRGDVTEAERVKIEAWLDTIGKDDNTDLELSREEEDRIFNRLTGGMEGMVSLGPKRKTRADQWILRIAASLLLVSLLAYVAWYVTTSRDSYVDVIATRGGVDKVILNDGSLVWSRGDTKVLYYEKVDEGVRYATFEGEALFEVVKDPTRPFVVLCGDARIRVVGTSFNVRATSEFVEVTVLTGSVNLSSATEPEGIDLLPREKAVYRRNGSFEKVHAREGEIAALMQDTDYHLQFTNTEIGEVTQRLGKKFNVTIEAADAALLECRITIDLTDMSLESALQLMSEVLNLTYTVEGKSVVISGHGCH